MRHRSDTNQGKLPKKISRKGLVKQLDDVFSLFIRSRDKKCVCCGSTQNLQCGHLLTRTSYSTRWDEINAACQCRNCNYLHETRPHVFTQWFIRRYGSIAYEELIARHTQIKKYKNYDLQKLIMFYRLRLRGEVKS